MSLSKRFRFIIKSVNEGLNNFALRRILIFFCIIAFLAPSFDDFLDYFLNFGPIQDAFEEFSIFTGILVLSVIYEIYLIDTRIRRIILTAILFKIANSVLNLMLAFGWTFGLSNT